jgi:hypothetical protein
MTNVKQNRAAWNRLAETGSQFASVATDEELQNPLQTLETRGWLPPEVTGLNVLCLAGGGGWQSILYAAAVPAGSSETPLRHCCIINKCCCRNIVASLPGPACLCYEP